MQITRRSVGALALLLALTSCVAAPQRVETSHVHATLASTTSAQTFTPEQVQYLAAQAWLDAERRAFLDAVAALAHEFETSALRPIAGCESSFVHRPHGAPVWDRYNQQGSSASGGLQMLDSTWRAWVQRYAPHLAGRWSRAAHAPWFVQISVGLAALNDNGTRPWNASAYCWR